MAKDLASITSAELTGSAGVDIRNRESIRKVVGEAALAFGGIDILINTAAIFPSTPDGVIPDSMWASTLELNVTANYLLADEAASLFEEQGLHGNIVFTSSANAVAAKRGSEAYDVSKAALSHLIRELAVSLAPNVRVNGISPATVVRGSAMFPRDRVRASLNKYNIPFQESFSDEELRSRLAAFYAERTLTQKEEAAERRVRPQTAAALTRQVQGTYRGRTGGRRYRKAPSSDPIAILIGWAVAAVGGVWMALAHTVGATVRAFGRHARDLDPAHRRDGVGLATLGLAIIMAAVTWFRLGGAVGHGLSAVVRSGFGSAAWVVPLLLGLLAWRYLRHPDRNADTARMIIGWTALIIGVLGLVNIAHGTPRPTDGVAAMRGPAASSVTRCRHRSWPR